MSSHEPTGGACHDCGAVLDPAANFCPQCGAAADPRPAFCSNCGEAFESGDEFCSHCGQARDGSRSAASATSDEGADTEESSAATDAADSESYESFRRRVRTHVEAGWEIEDDDGEQVRLVDREIGSVPIHVLLLLFTGGVGNLVYGWYHYSKRAEWRYLERGLLRTPEPPAESSSETTTESSATTGSSAVASPTSPSATAASLEVDSPMPPSLTPASPTSASASDAASGLGTLSSYGIGVFLTLIGLLFLAVAAAEASLIGGVIGALISLGGGSVFPPVKRRLDRRHGVTEFGRLRTVDHRVVYPTEPCEEPCVVCGGEVSAGLVRRRRDETVLAGVPVSTHSIRRNHYCLDCAEAERLIDLDPFDAAPTDATEAQPTAEVTTDG